MGGKLRKLLLKGTVRGLQLKEGIWKTGETEIKRSRYWQAKSRHKHVDRKIRKEIQYSLRGYCVCV